MTPKSNFPSLFKAIQTIWKRERSITEVIIHISNALALMIVGHLLFNYLTAEKVIAVFNTVDSSILYYVLGGFIAQMIDGALGMAYGVTATTFLLSVGITPAAASASVHASEVFTSGVSGYMHLKFGNVNSKLFKTLVIPGVIGAILGAYILSSLEEYAGYIKPIVSIYTLFLGAIIIRKALIKRQEKRQLKRVGWLALFGGYLDSIGGGGWGPIVSSTLIASGRHPKYTIGSVNLTEFFVSLASSITFFTVIGLGYLDVIIGLILGGVIAAPIAARLANKLPVKSMMILVGIVIIIVSLRQIILGVPKFL
jgi:uncharacterized membrane protein YfcA